MKALVQETYNELATHRTLIMTYYLNTDLLTGSNPTVIKYVFKNYEISNILLRSISAKYFKLPIYHRQKIVF